jgi:hypothetical protein
MSLGSTRERAVDERGAEVEVDAVRLVCELADRFAVGALGVGERVGGLRAGGLAFALRGLAGRGRLVAVLVDAAGQGLLDELAVELAVGDDRRAVLELDEHARGPRLIDLDLGEVDRVARVAVGVELLVERVELGALLVGLLAEPQIGDLARADPAEVGGERLRAADLPQRAADEPRGLGLQTLAQPRGVVVVDVLDDKLLDRLGDVADAPQGVDAGKRQLAFADELLRALGQLEELDAGGDPLL